MIVNHSPLASPMRLGDVPTVAVGEPVFEQKPESSRVEDLSIFLSILSSLFLLLRK